MPGGAKYGERRPQVNRTRRQEGYGKSELARIVGLTPGRISQLCKEGRLPVHEDGSIVMEAAHAYYPVEFAGTGVLIPEASKKLAEETLNTTRAVIKAEEEAIRRKGGEPMGPEGEVYDLERARARQIYMQSRKMEIEIGEMEGELIKRADQTRTIIESFTTVTTGLQNLERRLPSLVAGLTELPDIKFAIRREVDPLIEGLRTALLALVKDEAVDELREV